jgi:hypothetical protein
VAYVVLVGSVFTPLYEPLSSGEDDSWAVLVVLAGAHVGAGAALRRRAALLLPLPAGVLGVIVSESPLATAFAIVAPLIGAATIAFAWHIAWRAEVALGLAIAAFAVAAVPAAWAGIEQIDRADAPHAPPALEAQLPIELTLANLCPGAETPPALTRKLKRQAEVLLSELRTHPDWLVTFTYYYSDTEDPEDTRDITIRELAEEELQSLEDGGGDCQPELKRRLREALG